MIMLTSDMWVSNIQNFSQREGYSSNHWTLVQMIDTGVGESLLSANREGYSDN